MSDEIKIPVSLPLDDDGFLRRACPSCEQEFKWFNHEEGSSDAEYVDQYFCPRCGRAAGLDQWWTLTQLEYVRGVTAPAMDQFVNDNLSDIFKSFRDSKLVKVERAGSFNVPTPEPLTESNDMVIVQSPCHPNEPVKVPEEVASQVFCLICGLKFAT